jgi:hypothetical protein
MPLIGPLLSAQLRRHWQVIGAALVFLVFTVAHQAVFRPSVRSYMAALKRAGDVGLAFEVESPAPMMSPRVLALLTDNALPISAAGMERESGALTAALLEDVGQITTKHGMQVLATEPGITAQETKAVQVRARLRIQCSYPQLVAFLDDLSRSNHLIAVDRFDLEPGSSGRHVLELWVTRYILKQMTPGGARP